MSTATYRRSPRAIWRASSQLLVVAVPPGAPTRIAGSAALVWAQMAQPVTIDELVARLAVSTTVPAAAIRADVTAMLTELMPLGLVEMQP